MHIKLELNNEFTNTTCTHEVTLPYNKNIFFVKLSMKRQDVRQGFSISFPCGPQRAEDSSRINVWGPNDHHFPMYFYVNWSWQRAEQVWSAGRIWPTGSHLRRPDVRPLKLDFVFSITHPHYENCAAFDNQKSNKKNHYLPKLVFSCLF